jgi:signal transduction histidine kinase
MRGGALIDACGQDTPPTILVRVSVCDGDPGLSRSDQEHLFELFPQIDGTVMQSGSGVSLGLGLYLCKAFIEAHGGQVGG